MHVVDESAIYTNVVDTRSYPQSGTGEIDGLLLHTAFNVQPILLDTRYPWLNRYQDRIGGEIQE